MTHKKRPKMTMAQARLFAQELGYLTKKGNLTHHGRMIQEAFRRGLQPSFLTSKKRRGRSKPKKL